MVLCVNLETGLHAQSGVFLRLPAAVRNFIGKLRFLCNYNNWKVSSGNIGTNNLSLVGGRDRWRQFKFSRISAALGALRHQLQQQHPELLKTLPYCSSFTFSFDNKQIACSPPLAMSIIHISRVEKESKAILCYNNPGRRQRVVDG